MDKTAVSKLHHILYNFFWGILCVPFALYLLWHYRDYRSHRLRLFERFGVYKQKPKKYKLWLHLASVGEVKASLPLLNELLKKFSADALVVTTNTPTGEEVLRQISAENIQHYYLPFDFSLFMQRFISEIQPDCLILFETEIWPSLLSICQTKGVTSLLVNARLSQKSRKNYQRFAALSQNAIGSIAMIAAQTRADAAAFESLGATNVKVTGNIKTDIVLDQQLVQRAKKYKISWSLNGERSIILAASTHKGEDEIILAAFHRLREKIPGVLLVIAPRHANRFDAVRALCLQQGLRLVCRTGNEVVSSQADILLVDKMGELLLLSGCADMVIMGGTFIDHGGHNFLEPAAWGLPMVSGKSDYNFKAIAAGLVACGALKQLENPDHLADHLEELLRDKALRRKRGEAAKNYVEDNRGALGKLMQSISPHLEPEKNR